jgi:hypothetical protein
VLTETSFHYSIHAQNQRHLISDTIFATISTLSIDIPFQVTKNGILIYRPLPVPTYVALSKLSPELKADRDLGLLKFEDRISLIAYL